MILGQALPELAVVTLGSASARPEGRTIDALLRSPRWWLAHDADDAGDRAAEGWPARAVRVRPPEGFKNWTELAQAGIDLGRWWRERIEGNDSPTLVPDLDAQGWAGPTMSRASS